MIGLLIVDWLRARDPAQFLEGGLGRCGEVGEEVLGLRVEGVEPFLAASLRTAEVE